VGRVTSVDSTDGSVQPPRRIGAADSKTRALLVDAAEALLLEEGYAAVTSRKVGIKAGVKPQLVHYYFRTMDDLFLEVFRRRAEENVSRIEQALAAENVSLRTLWEINAEVGGATFTTEFAALANHRKAIRGEIARYAERFRAAQVKAITTALQRAGVPETQMPPIAGLLLMTGLAQILSLEDALGVTSGHADTIAFLLRAIDRLDSSAS
jgi:AcrR family transcriptional regulator